jgi:hypothetical protein
VCVSVCVSGGRGGGRGHRGVVLFIGEVVEGSQDNHIVLQPQI